MPTTGQGTLVALMFDANTLQHRTVFDHNYIEYYNIVVAAMQTADLLTMQG